MAAPVGPKKVNWYTLEFKIQAVRLSNQPEIQTQNVAKALDIHPFTFSKWKKDYREGKLKRQVKQLKAKVAARRKAQAMERKPASLEVEHDLLKAAHAGAMTKSSRRRSSAPTVTAAVAMARCGCTRCSGERGFAAATSGLGT